MNIKKLNEEIDNLLEPKYFYVIGDSEQATSYWDSDIYAYVPDTDVTYDGYQSKNFHTFEEALAALIEEDYITIDDPINFPKNMDLDEITEKDCSPKDYGDNYELFSYWNKRWEERGPEDRPSECEIYRFIQMFKKK